ncbi:2TM domain-containing protein [Chloroflexota bacterium]
MTSGMTEEQIYEEAKQRVKEKKGFWGHFATWAAINVMLIVIWALTDLGGYPWFLWPLCIWGVFVLFHYLRVFVFARKADRGAVEKEAEKIRREQG